MTTWTVIQSIFLINILIVVSFFLLKTINCIFVVANLKYDPSSILKIHYVLFCFCITCSIAVPLIPKKSIQLKSIDLVHSYAEINSSVFEQSTKKDSLLVFPNGKDEFFISLSKVSWYLVVLGFALFMIFIYQLNKLRAFYSALLKESYVFHKIGRVTILVKDTVQVPFSFSLWAKSYVVVPTNFLGRQNDLRMAVFHELQHIRQFDTLLSYLFWIGTILLFYNPIYYVWKNWIYLLQEQSCDHHIINTKKMKINDYCHHLLMVAETLLSEQNFGRSAPTVVFLLRSKQLKRRIKSMLQEQKVIMSDLVLNFIRVFLLSMIVSISWAAKSDFQDRRITFEIAEKMKSIAQANSQIPLIVNEPVLRQINYFIGSKKSLTKTKQILHRMSLNVAPIQQSIKEYDLPDDIAILPFVESGYQNLPEKKGNSKFTKSAGLWQFIRQTAINYGLIVNDTIDERMDQGKLTDAAMRYLKSNFLRFKDWRLAIMAYNMGENNLQQAMDKSKINDPWELINQGYEGDKDYLAKVIAAIIVYQNQNLIND